MINNFYKYLSLTVPIIASRLSLLFSIILCFFLCLLFNNSLVSVDIYIIIFYIYLCGIICFKKENLLVFYFFCVSWIFLIFMQLLTIIRENRLYNELISIQPSSNYNPKIAELFPNGPSPFLFYEKVFHGNLLVPWLPEHPPYPPITSTDLILLIPSVIFLIQFYFFCKKGENACPHG